MPKYKRIVLKLSGEGLAPTDAAQGCLDPVKVEEAARITMKLAEMGVQVGVVIGGGNIWRGRYTDEMNPVNADQMGMLATCINALAFQDAMERLGCPCEVMTATPMMRFAAYYNARDAVRALEAGKVCVFAGGSGNPFFTTDTAAALRACEIQADAVFKGTNVGGVYEADPKKVPGAKILPEISYQEAIDRNLQVMDQEAFLMCRKQGIKEIRVFSMKDLNNVLRVAQGEEIGSRVYL